MRVGGPVRKNCGVRNLVPPFVAFGEPQNVAVPTMIPSCSDFSPAVGIGINVCATFISLNLKYRVVSSPAVIGTIIPPLHFRYLYFPALGIFMFGAELSL
jgi:hypothetical protein